MSENINESLLEEVKRALMITWEDEQTDRTLLDYIQSSKVYFLSTVSDALTFEKETVERELLIERVRYRYNNAVDDFQKNFMREIAALIQSEALKKRKKAGESDGSNS